MSNGEATNFFGDSVGAFVAMQDHRIAACKRPKQLEHGNVERKAGDGKPNSAVGTEQNIHRSKETKHIPLLDHHAFWLSRGTGSVNRVRQILRPRGTVELWQVCGLNFFHADALS